METNSNGFIFTEPKESEKICIRKYVADVRRKDWKKCYPFKLSGDSPEFNYQAERIFASLTLEDNDALVNAPNNTKVPNSLTSSEVKNPDGQATISENHRGVVISNDATNTIIDTPLESASSNLTIPHCQIENSINGNTVAAENDNPEDMVVSADVVIGNDSTNTINDDTPLDSASSKLANSHCQIVKIINGDTVAAENDKAEDMAVLEGVVIVNDETNTINDTASSELSNSHRQIEKIINGDTMAVETDKPVDMVVDDESLKDIHDGASKSSSSKLKDDVQNIISEDTIDAGDEEYTASDEERNLAGEKPKKFRLLSDILKNLAGPSDAASARCGDLSDFSSESEDDSDEFTLDSSVKKRKGVRVTSKKSVVSRKKKKPYKLRERSFHRAKRIKPLPEDSSSKDPEVGSKRPLRKSRTDKTTLQVINKHKKSSVEIIVHDSTPESQNVAPDSLGGGENMPGNQKDSLISRGNKRSRETIQDDCGSEVLKTLDGSPSPFTEDNSSRSTHGEKSAELVQSTINNIETASGCVEKSITEDSRPIDHSESMAAFQLLRLCDSGETTQPPSKTATVDPASSVQKDDKMPSASESIMGQSHDESNMISGGCLSLAEQIETGAYACVMSLSPSDFSIPNAKKYMRRVKVIQKK